jgi:hypothetical protein
MKKLSVLAALLVLASGLQAYSQVVVSDGTSQGNQAAGSTNLSLIFSVNTPITVTYLGVFDNGSPTIAGTIDVGLYYYGPIGGSPVNTVVASAVFNSSGTYTSVGNDEFQAIAPLLLAPGRYNLDAVGFNASDLNGNAGCNASPYCGYPGNTSTAATLNTLGGALSYGGDYNGGAYVTSSSLIYPNSGQYAPPYVYNAATFAIGSLSPVPEGGASWLYLLPAGAACFGAMFFFRRNRFANLAAA